MGRFGERTLLRSHERRSLAWATVSGGLGVLCSLEVRFKESLSETSSSLQRRIVGSSELEANLGYEQPVFGFHTNSCSKLPKVVKPGQPLSIGNAGSTRPGCMPSQVQVVSKDRRKLNAGASELQYDRNLIEATRDCAQPYEEHYCKSK